MFNEFSYSFDLGRVVESGLLDEDIDFLQINMKNLDATETTYLSSPYYVAEQKGYTVAEIPGNTHTDR
ncbi:hypothetical protein Ciccas_014603, partial [Cichlidogyrus casuarinus]